MISGIVEALVRKLTLVLALAISPLAVQADEISGGWCSDGGASLHIEGNSIRTPGGQKTDGVYGHHFYRYVIPEGEEGAGLEVRMQQLSEDDMLLQVEGGEVQEWHRCQMVS